MNTNDLEANRDISYNSKDFAELRKSLINYTKNYFPDTYSDFAEASPAMHFIEMASYVGDVLNYYGDIQLQESMLYTANERLNLFNLAQGMGYKPQTIVPSQVDLEVMQLVPSIGSGNDIRPDFNYALVVKAGMEISTEGGIKFRTMHDVDFNYSSSYDPTEVSVYEVTADGNIEYYLLKKCVKSVQGELKSQNYEFEDAKIYDKIVLRDESISGVYDIIDADNNTWYEVDFMSQDLVPLDVQNIAYNNPLYAKYRSSVPYLLCYRQTGRRFVTRIRKDNLIEIQFGSGISSEADEEIVPNPYNVALGLDYFKRIEDVSIDPMNFIHTKTYGMSPSNTTLTVRYNISNGINGNVKSNSINKIITSDIINPFENIDEATLTAIKDTLAVNNPKSAYGGANSKALNVIRQEAMANFAAQNRAVTKDDYILRCYSMPDKFGAIAKAYIEQDSQISKWNSQEQVSNPYALNLYVLSYNANNQFVECNDALKHNLAQYMSQYRLMTDAINIKDPFIVNVGIEYEIITRPDQNSYEVILKCSKRLSEIFHQSKMEIGRPIQLNKLYTELDSINGVQTVSSIKIVNLYDTNLGYSGNVYDIETATRNNIIYPSLDPCIFEIKYPKSDIKGRVIDL